MNTQAGFIEVLPPVVVKRESLIGTGQLPKFEEDLYKLNSGDYLSPTGEVQLTNIFRNEIIDGNKLPYHFTTDTCCFRSEAGSAGKDTRGVIRQHQFYKTEMVKIVKPETSFDELEHMTSQAEKILESLKPYAEISKCIINRQTACKNDVLMFFDYPCEEDVLDNLKQSVCATALHYMNYQNYRLDEESILKSFASMIKYCCNNLEGKFVFIRAAAALGITEEAVETLLDVFADCGMIRIIKREEDNYIIESLGAVELSRALHSIKYAEFVELMNTINDYKNKFMTIEV